MARFSTKCPACGSDMSNIRSQQVTPLTRIIRFQCRNDDCGAIYNADLHLNAILVPSDVPSDTVPIPLLNQMSQSKTPQEKNTNR